MVIIKGKECHTKKSIYNFSQKNPKGRDRLRGLSGRIILKCIVGKEGVRM
jgi:hypothetical protein